MSRWSSIALGVKDGKPVSHPLDGKGNPGYRGRLSTAGTYQLASHFRKAGSNHPTEELFDSRNTWLKEGIASRVFPTWSSRALYEECGGGLYKSLLRQYHLKKQGGSQDVSEGPEDLWTDVQLYFIERTGHEQLEYAQLTEDFGSFSHYPMEATYRDGDELLLGILSLYHARIRECFKKSRAPSALSLDALEEDQGMQVQSPEETSDIPAIADALEAKIGELKDIDGAQRKILLQLLTLNGTWPARMKRLGNPGSKVQGRLRRWVYSLETRGLREIFPGESGAPHGQPTGAAKKNRRLVLRRLAEHILSRAGETP